MSFKNRVDEFYIAYITSKPLTMDVYLSKGQQAVHLGRCEVSLKQLIAGESSRRPAVIEDWSNIMPVGSSISRPLGKVKYVMRLRKGITEQMKMLRDRIEIKNITQAVELKQSSTRI